MIRNKEKYLKGMKDGIPIFLGYFAVSFTFGISAAKLGFTAFEASLLSFTNLTSAGQFSGIKIIADSGKYIELAFSQFIINSRYLLMSSSLSQKIDYKTPILKRALMAFGVTDENYSLCISSEGVLNPFYLYGITSVTIPGWTLGTFFGVLLGDILPSNIISALNIALYAMLIAAIIPASRQNNKVKIIIFISMFASFIFTIIPILKNLSTGLHIIIISIILTTIFALIFPIVMEDDYE